MFMCGLYICWNWSATIYFHPFLNATSKFFFCIIQLDCYAMCWWSCSYAFKQSYKEDSSLCTNFRNKSFPWLIPCWSALVWECIAQWGILPIWENAETVNGFGLSHTFTFLDVCSVHMSQPDFLPKIWLWKLVGCKHCLASEQRSEKWMCSVIGLGFALVWVHDVPCTCTFVGLLKKDFWCSKLALKNDKFLSFKSGASSDEDASSLVQICRY